MLQATPIPEKEKQFASRLMDLSYSQSEDIFGYLENIGYVHKGENGKRLWVFLEIVAFVLFWMDQATQKRVFGEKSKAWKRILSMVRHEWGIFFSGYPDGPFPAPLNRDEVVETLGQRGEAYDALFRVNIHSHGFLYARNGNCAGLLEKVLGHTETAPPFFLEETNEAAIHHLGHLVQELTLQVDATWLESHF